MVEVVRRPVADIRGVYKGTRHQWIGLTDHVVFDTVALIRRDPQTILLPLACFVLALYTVGINPWFTQVESIGSRATLSFCTPERFAVAYLCCVVRRHQTVSVYPLHVNSRSGWHLRQPASRRVTTLRNLESTARKNVVICLQIGDRLDVAICNGVSPDRLLTINFGWFFRRRRVGRGRTVTSRCGRVFLRMGGGEDVGGDRGDRWSDERRCHRSSSNGDAAVAYRSSCSHLIPFRSISNFGFDQLRRYEPNT